MSDQESRESAGTSDEPVGDLEPRAIDDADASSVKGGFTSLTAQKTSATGAPLQYDLKAQKPA